MQRYFQGRAYAPAKELRGARLGDFLTRSDPRNEEMLRNLIRSNYRVVAAESYEADSLGQLKVFQRNIVGTVEQGKLTRRWATQRDITERKRMLEALKDSEARLKALRQ